MSDKAVEWLRDHLDEQGAFDQRNEDGTVYCSDSNRTLDPKEIVEKIRELSK
jgi:hypothetical protein